MEEEIKPPDASSSQVDSMLVDEDDEERDTASAGEEVMDDPPLETSLPDPSSSPIPLSEQQTPIILSLPRGTDCPAAASSPSSSSDSISSTPAPPEEGVMTLPDVPPFQSSLSGKPLSSIRRGPGRPKKDQEGRGAPRPRKKPLGLKLKRWRSGVYVRGASRSIRGRRKDRSRDPSFDGSESPMRPDDKSDMDVPVVGDKVSASEDLPLFQEQWPGKQCALCNLGERSQLGQGDLMRLTCPEGFYAQKLSERIERSPRSMTPLFESDIEKESFGDKSPRSGAVNFRRQKHLPKAKRLSHNGCPEPVEELSVVGYVEEPDINVLFESTGHFYVHESCALWSSGVVRSEDLEFQNVAHVVQQSSLQRCSHCGHLGASISCKVPGCSRIYHFPCAAASGAFQDMKSIILVCTQHLDQVRVLCNGETVCVQCYALGNVSNLMMCTSCGRHYHGNCLPLALSPAVRAGWQCSDCRMCQVCRQPDDDTRLLLCEVCDKAYHSYCIRPAVATVPKQGWKCMNCRVCSDCGARRPGLGHSSRWHAHFTVCDSCYQQRNKGLACPLCGRSYRAAAQREMVQCGLCRKHVHGQCDSEADLATYQHRKESNPDYEYVCPNCKSLTEVGRQLLIKKRESMEEASVESSLLTTSQESLLMADDSLSSMEVEQSTSDRYDDSPVKAVGLGKGKPFCASKIAKKKLGLASSNRPKSLGKGGPGKVGFQKKQKIQDFARRRAHKPKMRGIFGVPGLGLQRPQADFSSSKSEEEPGVENRLVLCSSKDKFVLHQDICVMCGALGNDQEGCLISCSQCGQCYHPYCVNVKVTKVILQKGWRCLDCTVCEGCGQRNDEARLILCDDCDISYHIYCMDPPLDYVPHGNWKCKWCTMCQVCGSNDPGFNSNWQNNYSECGPCASLSICPACNEPYIEGELIIQCVQCERWIHGLCDRIRTEVEAERCAEEGYTCVLCRPRDVLPPHLLPPPPPPKQPPTPTKSPEPPKFNSQAQFLLDGVVLSEMGMHQIKALTIEQPRKKRKKVSTSADTEAGIMATIEYVVAGESADNSLEHGDSSKGELDAVEEPHEVYKEGMVVTPKEDGRPPEPPEGFTIVLNEAGVMVLRKKRQRNLQRLGVGGFAVRLRTSRYREKGDEVEVQVAGGSGGSGETAPTEIKEEKPRRKPQRRKPKNKLMETFPSYIQEAFFGRDLLDISKEKDTRSCSDSEDETASLEPVSEDKTIQLSQDELKAMEEIKAKREKEAEKEESKRKISESESTSVRSPKGSVKDEDDENDAEELKDILPLEEFLDNELVNTIMNEDDMTKAEENLEDMADSTIADGSELNDSLSMNESGQDVTGGSQKDELSDILSSPAFNLDSMVGETGLPNMDCKDVEDIIKGVLKDESQESQESGFPLCSVGGPSGHGSAANSQSHAIVSPSRVNPPGLQPGAVLQRPQVAGPLPSVTPQNLPSPMSFPPPSPYHSEYSNSPQFSPAFSEPPSPWHPQPDQEGETSTSYNSRNLQKMEADEALGANATISQILYANLNHPDLKKDYPNFPDRARQIGKIWRTLPQEKKAPYYQKARENRSAVRIQKSQQIPKEGKPTNKRNGQKGSPEVEVCSSQQMSPASHPSTLSSPQSQHIQPSTPIGQAVVSPGGPGQSPGSQVTTPSPSLTQGQSNCGGDGMTDVGLGPQPAERILGCSSDQQIRVLTPSEIMRTLPSLGQESYDLPASMDQDRIIQQQKSCREAEQERQWKQLQAMRQQQAQQQQQVIHEQRVQVAMARVHRQVSGDGAGQFSPEQPPLPLTAQLQVSTVQDPNSTSLSSPSPSARQAFPSSIHVNRVHAPQSPVTSYPQSRQELPARPTAIQLPRQGRGPDQFPRLAFPQPQQPQPCQDPYSPQTPQTPHPAHPSPQESSPQMHEQFPPSAGAPNQVETYAQQSPTALSRSRSSDMDPYSQSPQTPRPQSSDRFGHSPLQSPNPISRSQSVESFSKPSPTSRQHLSDMFQQAAPPKPRPSTPADHYVQASVVQRPQPPFSQSIVTARTQIPTSLYSQASSSPRSTPSQDIFNTLPSPQRPSSSQDMYIQPATPHPQQPQESYAPQTPAPQPPTPPADTGPPTQPGPEVERQQLRDLLQRQEFKKIEQDRVLQTQPTAAVRHWNPQQPPQGHDERQPVSSAEAVHPALQQIQQSVGPSATFRQPLPPSQRPRAPIPASVVVRGQVEYRHPMQNIDARLQNLDPRMRLLLQQRVASSQLAAHVGAALSSRLTSPRNPMDPYDHLVQQRQKMTLTTDVAASQGSIAPNATVLAQRLIRPQAHDIAHSSAGIIVPTQVVGTVQATSQITQASVQRIVPVSQPGHPTQVVVQAQNLPSQGAAPSNVTEQQEIPESVTAELEKLEQDGGMEGVPAELGDLGVDDDELLGMGNDFNILEYADPELDNVTGGEKTNILDNLDLEDDKVDENKEEHKGVKREVQQKVRPEKPKEQSAASHPQQVEQRGVPHPPAVNQPPQPQLVRQGIPQPQPQPRIQQVEGDPQQHQQQQVKSQQPPPPQGGIRPMGRLVSPNGPGGNVNVTFAASYQPGSVHLEPGVARPLRIIPGHVQVVQQRQQIRLGTPIIPGAPREGPQVAGGTAQVLHGPAVANRLGQSLGGPPPPPYPGPPPPYPGPCQQMGPVGIGPRVGMGFPLGPPRPPVMPQMGGMHPPPVVGIPHLQRRPLLLQSPLQEQPLLLEDLLEQEKREQEKQQQQQQHPVAQGPPCGEQTLLSDVDFERLKADVMSSSSSRSSPAGLSPTGLPAQGILPHPAAGPVRHLFQPRLSPQPAKLPVLEWQPGPPVEPKVGTVIRMPAPHHTPAPPASGQVDSSTSAVSQIAPFTANLLPAPPAPPEHIVTEQDRQQHLQYEQWLRHQQQAVTDQLKHFEAAVNKLRKAKKSLNSKQRQLRKNGQELAEPDALELDRISREQSVLQKHLDQARKQSRQHSMTIQDYNNKQQKRQAMIGTPPQAVGGVIHAQHSPLGPPASAPSPIHPSTPQSPMMSPSPSLGPCPSPMLQHSPLHSPLAHSPGAVLQHSPNPAMSPHSLQPSPRMGTPHSQGEDSPFSPGSSQDVLRSLPSPQGCPPRLTSPQGHVTRMPSPQGALRMATPQGLVRQTQGSAVSYADHRVAQQFGDQIVRIHGMTQRFVRSPMGPDSGLRPRIPPQNIAVSSHPMYSQQSTAIRSGVLYSSPMGSPQSAQAMMMQSGSSPMRRPSGNGSVASPASDRPLSAENPRTPLTPHTPYTPQTMHGDSNQSGSDQPQPPGGAGGQGEGNPGGGGGGNPNNPVLPFVPYFGRRFFKLGLRGGGPMWMVGFGESSSNTNGTKKVLPCDSSNSNVNNSGNNNGNGNNAASSGDSKATDSNEEVMNLSTSGSGDKAAETMTSDDQPSESSVVQLSADSSTVCDSQHPTSSSSGERISVLHPSENAVDTSRVTEHMPHIFKIEKKDTAGTDTDNRDDTVQCSGTATISVSNTSSVTVSDNSPGSLHIISSSMESEGSPQSPSTSDAPPDNLLDDSHSQREEVCPSHTPQSPVPDTSVREGDVRAKEQEKDSSTPVTTSSTVSSAKTESHSSIITRSEDGVTPRSVVLTSFSVPVACTSLTPSILETLVPHTIQLTTPATQLPPSSVHQANIGIPGATRASSSYPTFPHFPVTRYSTQQVPAVTHIGGEYGIPVTSNLSVKPRTSVPPSTLVADAISAARLPYPPAATTAALLGQPPITLPLTASTMATAATRVLSAATAIVATTTLVGPPRMSVPIHTQLPVHTQSLASTSDSLNVSVRPSLTLLSSLPHVQPTHVGRPVVSSTMVTIGTRMSVGEIPSTGVGLTPIPRVSQVGIPVCAGSFPANINHVTVYRSTRSPITSTPTTGVAPLIASSPSPIRSPKTSTPSPGQSPQTTPFPARSPVSTPLNSSVISRVPTPTIHMIQQLSPQTQSPVSSRVTSPEKTPCVSSMQSFVSNESVVKQETSEVVVKKEPMESSQECTSPSIPHSGALLSPIPVSSKETVVFKKEQEDRNSSCKYSVASNVLKIEESQNVLLKQLLQNTGCASQQGSAPSSSHASASSTTSSLRAVPSLEAQLARPVPPTPSSLLPPILSEGPSPKSASSRPQSRDTVPSPSLRPGEQSPVMTSPLQPEKKVPSRTSSQEEPPTPSPVTSVEGESPIKRELPSSGAMQFPIEIKKEPEDIQQIFDEKKEPKIEPKEELDSGLDTSDKLSHEMMSAADLKKLKRRQYQQKRRQSQGKEGGAPKKRSRKGSKVEEDHDSFIDNLINQLRQLPMMNVLEPELGFNFSVCPFFGAGDLSKLGTWNYSTRRGELEGNYGSAQLPFVADHYNTQPFGELPPLPPPPPVSQQRGFYDQEFAALKLDNESDEKKQDLGSQGSSTRERDVETPDSIISSSSPECVFPELIRFPGLQLIEDSEEEEERRERIDRRASPVIPIIAPIPIRLRPYTHPKDNSEVDKENIGVTKDPLTLKTRFGLSPPAPLRDSGNVTVTLTLTSVAAEDILGVLRNLANILHIPAPSGYHIVERTTTPPSQKLGLYRTKGKDGKEGAPIDIQSILNGAAKFCRHCDVVILNNLIKKKASELPFLSKEDLENGDDLYFCSPTCYMQFALTHRSSASEDKAATIVDHLYGPVHQQKCKTPDKDRESERTDSEDSIGKDRLKEIKKEPEEVNVEEKETVLTGHIKQENIKQEDVARVPEKRSRKHTGDNSSEQPPSKAWKGLKYKRWSPFVIQTARKYKKPTDKEMTETLFRMGITVTPAKIPDDTRKCMFCHQIGDGVADGTARLLNFDVDKWVHLNCALWSDEVYETVNGALMNLENALQQSLVLNCVLCHQVGATVRCFKVRCSNVYHLSCAVKDRCVFYKNKTTYCVQHVPKNDKDNELTTLAVFRRVYVNRDENRQVATVMHQADQRNLMRVGSLIFLSVGQLLPHQLQAFHTSQYIYPIGYKIVRFYWSMRRPNKRCRYICSIHEVDAHPEFRIVVQEHTFEDLELRDASARGVWLKILEEVAKIRKETGGVQLFPQFVTGEDLFGLTEPAVVRVLESLPGIDSLSDYRYKYGRNPLLELPLAVNPTGCARSEPKLRTHFKRPHTQRTGSYSRPVFVPAATIGEATGPYCKQFVHSKSSQYKKMKMEWRNNVFLARSKIQGLGLYAARDIERHTMVIEYIGELIRTELAELREKQYEARNRGIYMFRLDEERVVDATLSGGLARYINHSCNPNCVAEIVEVERDLRIIIFAKRRISRGEELAYDYKFDIEDDQHKIPCLCGAPNCRKWMN